MNIFFKINKSRIKLLLIISCGKSTHHFLNKKCKKRINWYALQKVNDLNFKNKEDK